MKKSLKRSRFVKNIGLLSCLHMFPSQEDDFGMDIGLGEEPGTSQGQKIEDEYFFEARRLNV